MTEARVLGQRCATCARFTHASSVTALSNREGGGAETPPNPAAQLQCGNFALMRPLKLLVISNPNARHLSVLEKLPDSTTITVGRHADAFESAASEADIILNG